MIVTYDTSVWIKRYLTEDDSAAVIALWRQTSLVVASWIAYAEMIASFARKRREGVIPSAVIDAGLALFRVDWSAAVKIAVDDTINGRVDLLHLRYRLRGADSIHLASALDYRDLIEQPVAFATADLALRAAAEQERLPVLP